MGGGGGGSAASPKLSQNVQPLQRHIWQFASRNAPEHAPERHAVTSESPWMPESHGVLAATVHTSHVRHLHMLHDLRPAHDGSHSSHLVSCGKPELHARNPTQKLQPLHLHVSQWEARFDETQ